MQNKAIPALILALILIIAGAFLPQIVGNLMDASLSNKIEFADASDIQLEFVQSDMSMEEILGILCKHTHTVEVPADLAVHTTGEIQQLTRQIISHYQDAGLITHNIDTGLDISSCIPMLHYQQASGRKSNIFWHLIFERSDNSWRLEMVLDDRTGFLCSVHYDDRSAAAPGESEITDLSYDALEDKLFTFADLFLSDLGDSFASLDRAAISAGMSTSVDEEYTSTTVTWEDSIKGDCHIVFYVMDTSFYTIHY